MGWSIGRLGGIGGFRRVGGLGCIGRHVVKEGIGNRNRLAHIAYLVHRLYQQLLVSVRIPLEVDFQLSVGQGVVIRAVDLHGRNAGMCVRGFDVQVFALDAGFENGAFFIKAGNSHAFLMLLAAGVGDDHFHSAVVQHVQPQMSGGQRAVNECFVSHDNLDIRPASFACILYRHLHGGAIQIPAGGRVHDDFIGCADNRRVSRRLSRFLCRFCAGRLGWFLCWFYAGHFRGDGRRLDGRFTILHMPTQRSAG